MGYDIEIAGGAAANPACAFSRNPNFFACLHPGRNIDPHRLRANHTAGAFASVAGRTGNLAGTQAARTSLFQTDSTLADRLLAATTAFRASGRGRPPLGSLAPPAVHTDRALHHEGG